MQICNPGRVRGTVLIGTHLVWTVREVKYASCLGGIAASPRLRITGHSGW